MSSCVCIYIGGYSAASLAAELRMINVWYLSLTVADRWTWRIRGDFLAVEIVVYVIQFLGIVAVESRIAFAVTDSQRVEPVVFRSVQTECLGAFTHLPEHVSFLSHVRCVIVENERVFCWLT